MSADPPSLAAAAGLFDLVATLIAEPDRDRAAAMCLDAARELAGAGAGVLYGLDITGRKLVSIAAHPALRGGRDVIELYTRGRPAITDPRCAATFGGKPVVLGDLRAVAGYDLMAIRRRDASSGRAARSLLVIPLRGHDNMTTGAMELSDLRTPDRWPADPDAAVPPLRAFAYLAGILLANRTLKERNHHLAAALARSPSASDTPRVAPVATPAATPSGVIAESPAMRDALALAAKVARSSLTVLLLGETGAGKDVMARAIHDLSPRRDAAFVAQNCAALPPDLLEGELFGYRKGAFTGAVADRKGLFAVADGGTLFLDEVGDLPLPLQAKLLRVLQDGEVRALGANTSEHSDVRIVAATNADLPARIADGRFREDLYYRLAAFPITLPPLRARPEDIAPLARHFLSAFAARHSRSIPGFTDEALARLRVHPFPGNARELRNIVERAAVMTADDEPVAADTLMLAPPAAALDTGPAPLRGDVQRYEAQAIRRALTQAGGNRTRAARNLGLGRRTLQEKINRYGLGDHAADDPA